jgi:hypothetical protein
MGTKRQIIFYPAVDWDDTHLVISVGRRMLFDFYRRENGKGIDTSEIDLKTQPKAELKAADHDYFNVIPFMHTDNDHTFTERLAWAARGRRGRVDRRQKQPAAWALRA